MKDSSTPQAMVESFRKITIDKTLDRPQRDLLTTWLINTQTGAARIRSSIPNGWIVGNKTGTGGEPTAQLTILQLFGHQSIHQF